MQDAPHPTTKKVIAALGEFLSKQEPYEDGSATSELLCTFFNNAHLLGEDASACDGPDSCLYAAYDAQAAAEEAAEAAQEEVKRANAPACPDRRPMWESLPPSSFFAMFSPSCRFEGVTITGRGQSDALGETTAAEVAYRLLRTMEEGDFLWYYTIRFLR